MKRLFVAVILSVFPSCGKPSVPCDGESFEKEAYACFDRESLGFALEFRSGTFIGQRPLDTLLLRNGGVKDLTVTSAQLSGDSAFTLTTEPMSLPATIKGNEYFKMQAIFAPTEARLYSAKIVVDSNAANAASKELFLSGCGVPTDGGTSPCYRDGGT